VTTLHDLVRRHAGPEAAGRAITSVLRVFDVAPVTREVLADALSLGWPDFEEAVQASAGLAAGAQYLITRDARGFRGSPIAVLAPIEFLGILGPQQQGS
jgi:hypothetical protein